MGVPWQERWFILRDTRLTCYASTETESPVLFVGIVKSAKRLDGLEVVDRARAVEYRHFFRVELSGGPAPLTLGAATETDALSWLTAIDAATPPASAAGEDSSRSALRAPSLASTSSVSVMGTSPPTASAGFGLLSQSVPGVPGTPVPVTAPLAAPGSKKLAKSEWKRKRDSVFGQTITKRGWVKHRGLMKQWALRFFVLKPPVLIYFKEEADEEKEAALGIILLKGCIVRERASKKDGFCFKILNPTKHGIYGSKGLKGETLGSGFVPVGSDEAILRVPLADEGREWIRSIEVAIEIANAKASATEESADSQKSSPLVPPRKGSSHNSLPPPPPASGSQQPSPPIRPTTVLFDSVPHEQSAPAPAAAPLLTTSRPATPGSVMVPQTPAKGATETKPLRSSPPPSPSPTHTTPALTIPVVVLAPDSAPAPAPAPVASAIEVFPDKPQSMAPVPPSIEVASSISKTLDPPPSHYIPEIPRPEMKIDAYEAGKSILLGLIKQLRPGMDLTKVVLPTHILEPRSFLEKTTDYFAHIELLNQAVHERDPVQRIVKLTKWYISGFYIQPKTVKKPYNPIIGETFRCMWDHGRNSEGLLVKSFLQCEQVSHHPPISAFFACNRVDGWVVNGSILFKSKFWGMSAGSLLDGFATITLPEFDEEYTVTFPSALAKGFIIGPLSMELFGTVVLECKKTGLKSSIEFKTKPAFRGEYNCVGGQIERAGDRVLYTLSGRFDREVYIQEASTRETASLWKVTPDLASRRLQRLVIPLEEQDRWESEKLWLQVTRGLISGDQESATEGKTRLEDEQRAGCREREAAGIAWITKRFDFDPVSKQWVYRWINKTKFNPKAEADEYESGGRVISVPYRAPVPIPAPAPTPTAVPAPAATSVPAATTALKPEEKVPNPAIAPGIDEGTIENGPLMIQELEQIRATVAEHAKVISQLTEESKRLAELEARVERLEHTIRTLTTATSGAPPAMISEKSRHQETIPAYVLLAMAVFMFIVVILVLRKLSQFKNIHQ